MGWGAPNRGQLGVRKARANFVSGAGEELLFDLPLASSSLSRLEGPITLYGQTISPYFAFRGKDATATTWPAQVGGMTLGLAGAGSNPLHGRPFPTTDADDKTAVIGPTPAKYYNLATAAHLPADGNDFILELALLTTPSSTHSPVLAVNGGAGITISTSLSSATLTLDGVAGLVNVAISTTPSSYVLLQWVIRRGVAAFGYCNGKPIGATIDISAITSLIGSSQNLIIGYKNADTSGSIGVAWFAGWQAASGWITNPVANDFFAERFLRFAGLWPALATGAALPTTWTRASAATVCKTVAGAKKCMRVGPHWPRVDESAVGVGYHAEGGVTNELPYSEELTNAAWVKTACTVALATSVPTPFPERYAYSIVGDATTAVHGVSQSIASVAGEHVLSAYPRAGAKSWVLLRAGITGAECWFHLDGAGSVGVHNASGGEIEALGDGYYRCTMVYTGGASAHDHSIIPAPSDGVDTYLGNGSTVDLYLIGVQHERNALGHATSYVRTAAASVVRAADDLRFAATGNVDATAGAVEAVVTADYAYAAERVAVDASNATASHTLRLELGLVNEAKLRVVRAGSTQADMAGIVSAVGAQLAVRGEYQAERFRLLVGGAESSGSPDTSGAVPSITALRIGADAGGSWPLLGRVGGVKIYQRNASAPTGDYAGELGLTLGDVYATVGRAVELHWPPTVNTATPTSYTYEVTVTPALVATASQDTERWTVTPQAGDIGSHTLRLVVKSGGVTIGQRTRTLNVHADSLTAARRVLFVGDSITLDGRYLQQLDAISADIAFVGTVPSTNGSIPCEGRGGWTAYQYATQAASPFVASSVINIPAYLATLGSTPEIVVWVLGVNDMRAYGSATACAQIMIDRLSELALAWQVAAPSTKHVYAYGPPCGVSYSADPTDLRDRMIYGYERMLAAFPGLPSSGAHIGLDRATDYTAGDALHPNATGYTALGDALWPALVHADRT